MRKPRLRTFAHEFKRPLGLTKPAHTVKNSPWTETFLRNDEPLSTFAEKSAPRDARIVEANLTMVSACVSHRRDDTNNLISRGVCRHDDRRKFSVALRFWFSLAKDCGEGSDI